MEKRQLTQMLAICAILLPGDDLSPPADQLVDLPRLIDGACEALGPEAKNLYRALSSLPSRPSALDLRAFYTGRREEFELLAAVAAAAYFSSMEALQSIGYLGTSHEVPPVDLAANELEATGLFDRVASGTAHGESG